MLMRTACSTIASSLCCPMSGMGELGGERGDPKPSPEWVGPFWGEPVDVSQSLLYIWHELGGWGGVRNRGLPIRNKVMVLFGEKLGSGSGSGIKVRVKIRVRVRLDIWEGVGG